MRKPVINSQDAQRLVSRRGLLLGGMQLAVIGGLGLRMRALQVEQAEDFRYLAEENRINMRLLPPSRGLIFDATGVPLAENRQYYRIILRREDTGDLDAVLERLQALLALDDETIAEARDDSLNRAAFTPVTVVDRASWEQVSKVSINAPALPGITAGVGLSRSYPLGSVTAHVVGYVGPVSPQELESIEEPDPVLTIPRFQIGKTGVEDKLEDELRGSAGTQRIEVNAQGRLMRELDRQEGVPGADIQLTIDAGLQRYVEARMDGQSASCVVMDVETGDLKAIASTPSFDPNLFVRGIPSSIYNELTERGTEAPDQRRPLASKAVQDQYPPGSTFKMITALAALDAGELSPEETVYCPGHTDVSGVRFHCWRNWGHGNMDLNESLQQSCDCYYYDISQRIGIDRIAQMARRLGLGERTGIPMSAERAGVAPDRAYSRNAQGHEWRVGDTVNASIGQGYVLATPIQLAVMTARLATGLEIKPRLIHRLGTTLQPSGRGGSLGLNENHLRRIRQAMYDVVNTQRGTAYSKRFDLDGIRMTGKTGTSQVRGITRINGQAQDEEEWRYRDHGLWVNFAPFDRPPICGGGGRSARGRRVVGSGTHWPGRDPAGAGRRHAAA